MDRFLKTPLRPAVGVDKFRMTQGKLKGMNFKIRKHWICTFCMGRMLVETDVRDKVLLGSDYQPILSITSDFISKRPCFKVTTYDPFEVPKPGLATKTKRVVRPDHLKKLGLVDRVYIIRKMIPGTAPGSPPRTVESLTEMVVVWMFPRRIWGQTIYAHDPLVVGIAIEEFTAKGEEVRVENAIILKDNAIFDMFKEPADGRRNTEATPQILIEKPRLHITGPINVRSNLPGQAAFLQVFRMPGPEAVGRHEQPRRLGLPQPFDNAALVLRAD